MCMCMRICVYVYVYVYINVHMYVHVYEHIYVIITVMVCLFMVWSDWNSRCGYLYVYVYVFVYVCTDCGNDVKLGPQDDIICRHCNYRILFKKRTQNFGMFGVFSLCLCMYCLSPSLSNLSLTLFSPSVSRLLSLFSLSLACFHCLLCRPHPFSISPH